jgi:hypothetical protein
VASLLTTKVEYRGAINVGTKAMWIRNLMGELKFPFKESNVVS